MLNACGSHDLTETTRAMAKRGSDDLKKLAVMQATLVCGLVDNWVDASADRVPLATTQDVLAEDISRLPSLPRRFPACPASQH